MLHQLPELPYAANALEPVISAETIEFHYGKHHRTYVDNLNKLIVDTEFAAASLEEIIKRATGGLFNNAAQVWNHSFYWQCLSPQGGGEPQGSLGAAITKTFGSFANFKQQFTQSATTNFGSGWTWLIKKDDQTLEIVNTSNAVTPLSSGQRSLLTIDVWEHAYYIDYRNARPSYLEAIWDKINWDFVAANYDQG
jgi:Fe-Mn family superoxide dismutase